MEGVIDKGYVEKCTTEPKEGKVWYIPHHGVFHPKKKKNFGWYSIALVNSKDLV